MQTRSDRVVVGLSGGVDSAVTAWLLKQEGYEVVGLFMKNWEDDDDSEFCSSRQDWIDAASVADVIGIELEAVNFAAQYKDRVFAEFLREYSAGRTPNPDVLCNAEIKFKAFLDHALRLGAERIATGHYARARRREDGAFELLRGLDAGKDQSYFLHRLDQQQLSKVLFPLGGMHKSQVRRLALEIGLPNAAKRDSTGICFIGERPFREFLSRYLPTRPGPILDDDGTTVGEHVGLAFYTLGQRKGIGIGGVRAGSGEPWYVARKDVEGNALYVVQGHDHPWLLSRSLHSEDIHWIGPAAGAGRGYCAKAGRGHGAEAGRRYGVKTRYRQADAGAELVASGAGVRIDFEAPQWAVTPGQSAVIYDGEVCLGGGIITSSLPLTMEAAMAAPDPIAPAVLVQPPP